MRKHITNRNTKKSYSEFLVRVVAHYVYYITIVVLTCRIISLRLRRACFTNLTGVLKVRKLLLPINIVHTVVDEMSENENDGVKKWLP